MKQTIMYIFASVLPAVIMTAPNNLRAQSAVLPTLGSAQHALELENSGLSLNSLIEDILAASSPTRISCVGNCASTYLSTTQSLWFRLGRDQHACSQAFYDALMGIRPLSCFDKEGISLNFCMRDFCDQPNNVESDLCVLYSDLKTAREECDDEAQERYDEAIEEAADTYRECRAGCYQTTKPQEPVNPGSQPAGGLN